MSSVEKDNDQEMSANYSTPSSILAPPVSTNLSKFKELRTAEPTPPYLPIYSIEQTASAGGAVEEMEPKIQITSIIELLIFSNRSE